MIKNAGYKSIHVDDLLLIKKYVDNHADYETKALLRSSYVQFGLYIIIALWDNYMSFYENNTRHIDYWINTTKAIFEYVRKEYNKLPSADREFLKELLINARIREAYGLYYKGKVSQAVTLLKEIRDNEIERYEDNYQVRYQIDESLVFWLRKTDPEDSLKISDDFIRYADSKDIDMEDEAYGTVSFYGCIALYELAVRKDENGQINEGLLLGAVDRINELLEKLSRTESHNEDSPDPMFNKFRLLLVQVLCRLGRYDECIPLCEKEIVSREAKGFRYDSIFLINALITLAKIYTYKYRDSKTTDNGLYEKAESILKDAKKRLSGSIREGQAELVYAEVSELKYVRTKETKYLQKAKALLQTAANRYRIIGGTDHYDYICSNNKLTKL